MGSHRTQHVNRRHGNVDIPKEWPPLPNNIGKRKMIAAIDGKKRHFRIEDEIIRPQSNSNRKIIVFQKMRYVEENRVEFRFGYYMIGLKPKAKGRWVWGQYCLLIPETDLMAILKEAGTRGWFKQVLLTRKPEN